MLGKNFHKRILSFILALLMVFSNFTIFGQENIVKAAVNINDSITVHSSTAKGIKTGGTSITPNLADGINIESYFTIKGKHNVGDTFTIGIPQHTEFFGVGDPSDYPISELHITRNGAVLATAELDPAKSQIVYTLTDAGSKYQQINAGVSFNIFLKTDHPDNEHRYVDNQLSTTIPEKVTTYTNEIAWTVAGKQQTPVSFTVDNNTDGSSAVPDNYIFNRLCNISKQSGIMHFDHPDASGSLDNGTFKYVNFINFLGLDGGDPQIMNINLGSDPDRSSVIIDENGPKITVYKLNDGTQNFNSTMDYSKLDLTDVTNQFNPEFVPGENIYDGTPDPLKNSYEITFPTVGATDKFVVVVDGEYETSDGKALRINSNLSTGSCSVDRTSAVLPTSVWATGDGSFAIQGTKMVDGGEGKLKAGDFTFILKETLRPTGETEASDRTVTNDEYGNITFADIKYTAAGTYVYEMSEDIPADDDKVEGMTYDETKYEVTVKVTEEGNGVFVPEYPTFTRIEKDGTKTPQVEPSFNNTTKSDSIEIPVEKVWSDTTSEDKKLQLKLAY